VGSGGNIRKCKILDDLMPINVTVTNSGKIALPEYVKNVSVYINSFKIKFQSLPFYHLGCHGGPMLLPGQA